MTTIVSKDKKLIERCPICGKKLIPSFRGEDWFFCDNCTAYGKREETQQKGREPKGGDQFT